MKRIVLISDTHGPIPEDVQQYVLDADELWHAGDLGVNIQEDQFKSIQVRAVYGNIDDHLIRRSWPEYSVFEVEAVRVLILHIGGYPGRYNSRARTLIEEHRPDVVVVGHSHILKIVRDNKYKHIHLNPGACGYKGFHRHRTFLRFQLDSGQIKELEVVELGDRSKPKGNPKPEQSRT